MEFNLDRIAERLRRADIEANVEMTGGGVATLYAGPPVRRDDDGWLHFACAVGPGWFDPSWPGGVAKVDTTDLYVGPDDLGETYPVVVQPNATEDDVVALVAQQVVKATEAAGL